MDSFPYALKPYPHPPVNPLVLVNINLLNFKVTFSKWHKIVHIVEVSLSLRFQFEFRLKNIVRLSTSYVNNEITQFVGK